jgi:hypothetical protein
MKNSSKNLVIAFLALAALGGGVLAWQQYVELVALRASATNPGDRAAERARLAAAERHARELEDQLAAVREGTFAGAEAEAPAAARGPNQNFGGRGRGGPANMRAMMENPEVRKLMAQQQKAGLDARFAGLFKALNLPAAQLDKFKSLLLEKQSVMQDVMMAAREQGLDPRSNPEGFRSLVNSAQAEIDTSLKAVIGEEAFTQYQQYQQAQPQRNVLTQLEQSLSYTDSPLTTAQSTQLLQILAATATTAVGAGGPPDGGGRGGPMGAGTGTGPTAVITPQTIAQAQTVLNTTQVQALQQLQQTQQAQQQLEQILRSGGGATGGGGTTPSARKGSGEG